MAENERALSARVLELEGALSAQHEAMESLRWARAQLERVLQKVSRERDEARAMVSELQRALDRREEQEPAGAASGRHVQPTIRVVPPVSRPCQENGVPTLPAPPRERAPSVTEAERRERVADSGTYSLLDVSAEQVVPRRRRRIAR
ncbi:MAG: hypothetical protein AB7K71_40805 [Polyangiaceae bacterium]